MIRPVVADFETYSIQQRPRYPPKPVGVAIKMPGKASHYYAFAHPTKNNCTEAQAKATLRNVWGHREGLLFHNAKFDVDVAQTHWGLALPPWQRTHDSLLLLFLDDPNQTELALKPSATRLLNEPPSEQEAVRDWLIKNQPVAGIKISASRESEHYWAGYIAYAPGDLVGRYACGDVDRTSRLFNLLYPSIIERGMDEAYMRERQLMPVLLETERQGMRVDKKRLEADIDRYEAALGSAEKWVFRQLKMDAKDINLNSGAELVKALVRVGKIDLDKLGVTPKTGKPKTDKESLKAAITDPTILTMLGYRGKLNTSLRTFMRPWAATAKASNGLIFTNWNQTRGSEEGGTRTGRLSSTPNFQNIPKEFKPVWQHELPAGVKFLLPKCPLDLPSLPLCRGYIIPYEPGHVLIDRDFSSQEPRILAHFEEGVLLEAYKSDPWTDFHAMAQEKLEDAFGRKFDRKFVKGVNLGIMYSMGIGKMAEVNNVTVEEAKTVRDAILSMYPGIKAMNQEMRARAMNDLPIRTWGGREYYVEKPRLVNGRFQTYEYKLLNTLIQGSAADCTKTALNTYWCTMPAADVLYASIHDELLVSVPKKTMAASMECLRQAMEGVSFDVPMLSEGSTGPNWGDLKDYDKKGCILK